jgi:hypothetical protein
MHAIHCKNIEEAVYAKIMLSKNDRYSSITSKRYFLSVMIELPLVVVGGRGWGCEQ